MSDITRRARYSRTAYVMCACEGAVFLALLAIGTAVSAFAFPFERPGPFAAGLFVGCAMSAAKILLLDRTLTHAVDMGSQAKNYAAAHAALRYICTAAVFVPPVALPRVFGLFGVVAGVLSLQLSAYLAHIALLRLDRRE